MGCLNHDWTQFRCPNCNDNLPENQMPEIADMSEYDRPDAYYRYQEASDRELEEMDEMLVREPDENQVDAICILLETLAMSGQFRKLAEGLVMDGITEARLIECYRSATDPAVFSEVMKFIA